MDPTPAELPPGCLVLLLRLSAGMTADVVTGRGEIPAFVAARQLADELVEGLVNTASASYALGPLDVAVLGYRTAEDGSPQLFSLLPDRRRDPAVRSAGAGRRDCRPKPAPAKGQPKKWAVLPPCEGEPCAADGARPRLPDGRGVAHGALHRPPAGRHPLHRRRRTR